MKCSPAIFICVGLFVSDVAFGQDSPSKPNIVLILADDLGYGDVGCYNAQAKIPTPNIDRLAEQGTRFTDAHSPASVCVPTRYSLLTGRFSFRRPNRNGSYDSGPLIEEGIDTLPAMLKRAGYRTEMVGKWHLGFGFNNFDQPLEGGPVDRGFDTYFGIPASTDIPPYFYVEGDKAVAAPTKRIEEHHSPDVSPIQGAFWRSGMIAPDMELVDVLPTFAEKAEAVIASHSSKSDRPFFLYLALAAPHTPWLPTEPFQGRSRIRGEGVPEALGAYGDFVVQVDDIVGRVLKQLEKAKLAENTLVIFSSDNGPTWYDTNAALTGHDSAGPWRGMKGDAWEAGHRIPFIVKWPGQIPAAKTSDELICQVDFMATFAAIVGEKLAMDAAVDSENLLPVFLDQPDARGRTMLVTQASSGTLALRKGKWKYIPQLGSAGFSDPKRVKPVAGEPSGQLYDLDQDPGETVNLAGEQREVAEEMNALLEEIQNSKSTASRTSGR